MGAIRSVQKLSLTMADGVSSVTALLSTVDTTRCVPRITYRNTSSTNQGWDDSMVDVEFLTLPNRIQVSRVGTDGEIQVKAVVIEFDTAGDIVVQTGTLSMTGASQNVTIDASSLTKSFATFGYDSTQADDIDNNFVRGMLTTTTNLAFVRTGTTGTIAGHWWVVEDTGSNFTVQRVLALAMTGTSASQSITTVDAARASTFCSQSNTSVTEAPENVGAGRISSSAFQTFRAASDGTVSTDAFVLSWEVSSGITTQRGNITMGSGQSSGTQATTATDLAVSFAMFHAVPNGLSSTDTTRRQTTFGSIEQTSTTEVTVLGNDDSSVETCRWELVEFVAVVDELAIVFGTNF